MWPTLWRDENRSTAPHWVGDARRTQASKDRLPLAGSIVRRRAATWDVTDLSRSAGTVELDLDQGRKCTRIGKLGSVDPR